MALDWHEGNVVEDGVDGHWGKEGLASDGGGVASDGNEGKGWGAVCNPLSAGPTDPNGHLLIKRHL